ncbi:eCIS core domain-containing protein [Kribbella kalugense]|uniref:Uncharacterized protein DUF4157 n=1 Tax=Kribbella kalugense TaxID=2512221 RepID=A0A4R7ZVG2_9ACTN|nr:DUF4157 domain-containing protein [Kribbella kalugense]TDW22079.1 uncharacterized protein DUF4157 [Kribbella kalugense]
MTSTHAEPQPLLQRCGGKVCPPGTCNHDDSDELQRHTTGPHASHRGAAPPVVHDVLRSPGHALDGTTRADMSEAFGHRFDDVRVHTDALAARSAQAVEAMAYTVGRDIVFDRGRYSPGTSAGRELLAHELTHVVQQRGMSWRPGSPLNVGASDTAAEHEARSYGRTTSTVSAEPTVARADPRAVQLTRQLHFTPRTGLKFLPVNIVDSQVGPTSAQGGLLTPGLTQLQVIIGQNLTLRALAAEVRPLWLTATPFTPPGAVAPLPLEQFTQDELARGLLVFNQTYLPTPAMTNWRAGVRFPLPAEVDAAGMVTLHPSQIKALAGAFDPVWEPLLDQRAGNSTAPPAATLTADVTAFLAREPTALAQGIHLGARALTDATVELPFIRETFRQLGAGGFDVALAFMDNLVNREIDVLAAQRDGAAVLALIRTAFGAAPAVRTPEQQASLDRANLMMGLVAGRASATGPVSTRPRPMRTITIDTVKLDGSTHTPATDVAIANAIFAQCNVRIEHVHDETATAPETTGWIGANRDLAADPVCAVPSAEVSTLVPAATARFGLTSRIRAFFPRTFSLAAGRGFSWPASCGPVPSKRNTIVVQNAGTERTLAHEIGHILLNPGPHQAAATQNVMVPTAVSPLAERFTDADCASIYTGF